MHIDLRRCRPVPKKCLSRTIDNRKKVSRGNISHARSPSLEDFNTGRSLRGEVIIRLSLHTLPPSIQTRGGSTGARGPPPMKNAAPQCPAFWPSLPIDFHLNRPVISLIQLHIVPHPQLELWPPIGPHLASATVPEPPLIQTRSFVPP